MDHLLSPEFWLALGEIVLANILLSGDNAVVIALAARGLPAQHQRRAIALGSGAAIVMRIALTIIAVKMLTWPFLKIVGGILLGYIGVTLMSEGDGEEGTDDGIGASSGLMAAIRTILVADLVMSLDNVLAVAAAAKGNLVLLIAGLTISIPLIIFGSTMLLKIMDRFPIIITVGAALLGFLAGEMLLTDPAVPARLGEMPHHWVTIAGAIGAAAVVIIGKIRQRRMASAAL